MAPRSYFTPVDKIKLADCLIASSLEKKKKKKKKIHEMVRKIRAHSNMMLKLSPLF